MNCIAAVDKNWGIGRNNSLLFHIPEDMKHFKEKTVGNVVIMGKNTLLSFPNAKPLANRTNIVLSSELKRDDCTVCGTLNELWRTVAGYDEKEIFVIGGGSVYRQLLKYCERAYITKVNADGGADAFFPILDKEPNWKLLSAGRMQQSGGFDFCFCEYKNNKPDKWR